MSRVFVGVLGSVRVTLNGEPVHLEPLMERVLLRLVVSEDTAVPADDIFRDVWYPGPCDTSSRRSARVQVQKHISKLRDALGDELIITERSAYRIVLDPGTCDWLQFKSLVEEGDRADRTDPVAAAQSYDRALGLLPDKLLPEGREEPFCQRWVEQAARLRNAALRGAADAYRELGDPESALMRAERHPDREFFESVREEKRIADARGDLVRRAFPELGTILTVRTGDLFDQDDANLAVGFGDMFDTDTDQDTVISKDSVQGQLLDRIYDGDRAQLDLDLDKALETGGHIAIEENDGKPRGKRRRYAIGTTVPLPLPSGGGRTVFAFAHCRQGEDFVTWSAPEDMDTALAALWTVARVRDMYRPLAMPVIGSGAARVKDLNRTQLTAKMIASFLAACRREGGPCAKELRIMVRAESLTQARRDAICKYVHELGSDGREPARPGVGLPSPRTGARLADPVRATSDETT